MTQQSVVREKQNTPFYDHLRDLCSCSGKSINQVEKELGYPRNTLHNYRFKVSKGVQRLVELSHYFGVSSEYLMGEDKPVSGELKNVSAFYQALTEEQKKELAELILDHQEAMEIFKE